MKRAIIIHRAGNVRSAVEIKTEAYPKEGLSPEDVQEEALALRNWLGENLPGNVFDKLFERERVKEIPGRIDIPVNNMGNLSEIQRGNFSLAILAPSPIPVKDEARNVVALKDNPGPMRLVITIEEKSQEER